MVMPLASCQYIQRSNLFSIIVNAADSAAAARIYLTALKVHVAKFCSTHVVVPNFIILWNVENLKSAQYYHQKRKMLSFFPTE